jgi:hypothetical protein
MRVLKESLWLDAIIPAERSATELSAIFSNMLKARACNQPLRVALDGLTFQVTDDGSWGVDLADFWNIVVYEDEMLMNFGSHCDMRSPAALGVVAYARMFDLLPDKFIIRINYPHPAKENILKSVVKVATKIRKNYGIDRVFSTLST